MMGYNRTLVNPPTTLAQHDAEQAERRAQRGIEFGGAHLPELLDGPLPEAHEHLTKGPPTGAEIATALRELAASIRPEVYDVTLQVAVVRNGTPTRVASFALKAGTALNHVEVPWVYSPGDRVEFTVEVG